MSTHDGAPDAAPSSDTARFAALWDSHAGRVQAYALRRTDPDTAQDVVAETFLVAWRRMAEVPDPALPWLLVVARNHARNAARAHRRRELLAETLTHLQGAAPARSGPDAVAVERDEVFRALARLREIDREALLLVAWDGLTAAEAAFVAGCTRATFDVRLHRARRRMNTALDAPEPLDAATIEPTDPAETRRPS